MGMMIKVVRGVRGRSRVGINGVRLFLDGLGNGLRLGWEES
jgi:hypothetical protein